VTGDDGVYEFVSVPDGAYSVDANRTGYVGLEFRQRRAFERGERIWVENGRTIDHVDIALPRDSIVAGRILDESGDPIEGATVRALQTRYRSGRRRLIETASVRAARTDDRGRYRLYGLTAGTFLVSAEI